MTLEQIAALVTARKSQNVKLKRTTGECREAAQTVCAMLN